MKFKQGLFRSWCYRNASFLGLITVLSYFHGEKLGDGYTGTLCTVLATFFYQSKVISKNVYMKKRKTGSEKLNTNIPGKCK